MAELFAVEMAFPLKRNVFNQLIHSLEAEERYYINKYNCYKDACKSLLGVILSKVLICKTIGIPTSEILFIRNKYGKPVVQHHANIHFNISHSNNWIVSIVGSGPLGVDIEQLSGFNLRIAERFYAESEYLDLMKTEEIKRKEYFFELWTLKESYLKAIGKGLSVPLNSFSFHIDENKRVLFNSGKNNDNFQFKLFNKFNEVYNVAICIGRNERIPVEIEIIKLEFLLKKYLNSVDV